MASSKLLNNVGFSFSKPYALGALIPNTDKKQQKDTKAGPRNSMSIRSTIMEFGTKTLFSMVLGETQNLSPLIPEQ